MLAPGIYEFLLTKEKVDALKKLPYVKAVESKFQPAGTPSPYQRLFPYDDKHLWNVDNYGAIYLPKEGATIALTQDNISIYQRCIVEFEGNKLDMRDGKFFINDKETTTYTFKQGYYWMMGDNRHNSADSRFWGFVPEDHIVGKAVFIWMSWDSEGSFFSKIRWKRLFSLIHD